MAYTWDRAKKVSDEIIKNKEYWNIANNVKHKINGMPATDYYKKQAEKYYNELRANGYETLASNLQNSDYNNAKKYMNTFQTKMGRNQFRPYMYEKAKSYGMTNEDIDKLTSFDTDTGEVIFAGKNIGKPLGIIDGTSYFDSGYLDGVWNDYVTNSGISRSREKLEGIAGEKVNTELDDYQKAVAADREYLTKRNEEESDYTKNHNPFETATGKAIMDRYDYLGKVASGNALADGAGQNSGNVDSFSAANAARQQLAFTTAGSEAVINDFNARLENSKEILKNLGVDLKDTRADMMTGIKARQEEAQRLFENEQSKLLNEQSIKESDKSIESADMDNWIKVADTTGYVPLALANENNPYLNKDGTVKSEKLDIDYNALITTLEKKLASETNADMKAAIEQNIRWANDARNAKVDLAEYKQYANDRPRIYSAPQETANMKLTKAQMQNAVDLAKMEYDSAEKISVTETEANKDIAKTNADVTKYTADLDYSIAKDNLDFQRETAEKEANTNNISYTQSTYTPEVNTSNATNTANMVNDETVEIVTKPGDYETLKKTINEVGTDGKHKTYSTHSNANSSVDWYGLKLLENYFSEYGEIGSIDDFITYAVENSAVYCVDTKQLKKVCRYLGMNDSQIKSYVSDRVKDKTTEGDDAFRQGMTWKK